MKTRDKQIHPGVAGEVLKSASGQALWTPDRRTVLFSFGGTLRIDQNQNIPKFVANRPGILTRFDIQLVVAPGGSAANFFLTKNAVVTLTAIVSDGFLTGTSGAFSLPFVAGDIFGVLIDQVGASVPGTTASMMMRFNQD